MIDLMPHQQKAVDQLDNGKILYGGVGAGKSATVLAYYVENESPKPIVVITTAKKRDNLDWEEEAIKFGITTDDQTSLEGPIIVESWHNIGKFEKYENYFFVFDEQRLVGYGAWVKSFLKIVKNNHWVLLSATPGDTWLDYAPVFIANGFYRNITHFKMDHVLYEPYSKFPKVKGYLREDKLAVLRNEVLVEMPYLKHTERILNYLDVDYDAAVMERITKHRWNVYEDKPIRDVAEMFRLMRRLVNSDPSRIQMVRKLLACHDRVIIFYTHNYELEILRELRDVVPVYEWNGHRKDPLPEEDRWVYLVQYVAGAEGWNCTTTDAMILYSLTYSYKNFEQAQGRIDRLNTPYTHLYYYILSSNSAIDRAIRNAITHKKTFNERKFARDEGLNLVFDRVDFDEQWEM